MNRLWVGSGSSQVAFDRRHNPLVSATTAWIPCERFVNLRVCWVFILGEKGAGRHDHAVDAVATLHSLLIDKGLLQFAWLC